FNISAFKLNHTVLTYGFVFKENDKIKFDLKKCKKLGIKGEMFKHLELKGHIIINNRKILLKNISFKKLGRKVVYSSDTRPCTETIKNSKNANVLIHESSYTAEYSELAKSRKHSTVLEAAKIAKISKVNLLILTHFSARYKDDYELIKEAKTVFNNVIIGKDGYKTIL
ncbi:MAG: hypothetical protein QXD23_03260, partial [Candidatus Micrarchaeaceae archaeon]